MVRKRTELFVVRPPMKPEDHARSFSYAVMVAWAVVFFIFPPSSSVAAIDFAIRAVWLGLVALFGILAFIGSVRQIDLRLELPALYVVLAGPALYFLSQFWFSIFPAYGVLPGQPVQPGSQRYALTLFALYAFAATLPRLLALREKRRQTDLSKKLAAHAAAGMTETQKAQPGAFPELKGD